jgi:hypothetical protein
MDFNWLIITDDKGPYDYPNNVTVLYQTFEDVKQVIQSKFDFTINLDTPHKICDFKPAFGYIFQEYIEKYKYWGHCDPDIIWGHFNTFLDFEKLKKYDKIFALGHLTLYKNEYQNNRRFLEEIEGKKRYEKVFSNPIGFAFDEKFNKSINSIYKENNYPIFLNSNAADIDSYNTNFRLSVYDYGSNTYSLEKIKKQLFVWEEGSVFRYFIKDNVLVKEEFMYVHLQKRKMNINFNINYASSILITPKEFIILEEEITIHNFNIYCKKYWFNNQYFKVKWSSFKYKLRFREYFYGRKNNF